jgi:hypothetical protein
MLTPRPAGELQWFGSLQKSCGLLAEEPMLNDDYKEMLQLLKSEAGQKNQTRINAD